MADLIPLETNHEARRKVGNGMMIILRIEENGMKLTQLKLKLSMDFVSMLGYTNQITKLCPCYGQRIKGGQCSPQPCLEIDLQAFSSS